MTGSLFTLAAVVVGGVDTGGTFYAPLSTTFSDTLVVPALIGVIIVGFSSILTGSQLRRHHARGTRARHGLFPHADFLWTMYATSLIFLLATPVITMALVLLVMERAFGLGVFDPALGGYPVLFEHLFWFYSHRSSKYVVVGFRFRKQTNRSRPATAIRTVGLLQPPLIKAQFQLCTCYRFCSGWRATSR